MRRSAIALACLALGCDGTSAGIRARFATERSCPEAAVEVEAASATRYHAAGCGARATYLCEHMTMSRGDVRRCVEEGSYPARRPEPRDRPALPPADPRVPTP